MKNFTKQNFKTNPLWIRLLIMSFMVLLSTGSAWAVNNATKSDGSYRFYFQFKNGHNWWNGSGCNHYAWVWANGGAGQIQRIYKIGTTSNASTGSQDDVFYMNIPNGMVLHGMILFRGNPSKTNPSNGSTSFPADDTYYNKTADIILTADISSKNYITGVSQNSSTVTTSTYKSVSIATTSLTASNAKSGSGTQADPYVFDENTTMKLSASATIDDHNFQIQLAYGSSTSMKTSGSSQSIDVALTTAATATAYTVTYTPCLGGSTSYKGTASTKTIYYKTEKSCETPSDSQYKIGTTEYTWDGTAKKPTVSANTGAGDPTSTVYKQGNTTVANPTDVGTYDVYVSSNDGTTYCGANDLKVGSFEIKCKEGKASDLYTLTKSSEEYVGAPRGTGVTPVTGAGTATIIYKQGDEVVNPINVGIYDVYITSEAGTGYCAITTPTKIGTFEVTCKTATASQYTISQTSYTYDGNAKKPTVSKASGATAAGDVTSTVYKQGNTTVANPTNAGTYDIYITTAAGTGYCALTNFKVGSFTIKGKAPQASDFTYTAEKNYTGAVVSADVAWKTGLAAGTGGAITTYYKVKGANDNTYTTAQPSAVGIYTVAVTTEAGGNYAAATTKIALGDFTINEVCDPITNLTWRVSSGAKATYCSGDKVQVTMTYNGNTATAYSRGGNYDGNIDFNASSLASGVVYTFTIRNSGTISLTLTGCDGKPATTETLTFNVMAAPDTPTVQVVNNIVKCGNDFTQHGKIRITNYNSDYSYKIGANNDPLDPSAIDVNGNISGLTIADKFTLYAINSCGVATPSAPFEITESDNKPAITGTNSFQPGGSTVLTSNKGANTIWKADGGKLSAEKGASVTFSADTNRKYIITAIYNDCETEFVVSVQDDIYVWMRKPNKKENAYNNFYYINENPTQGGMMYYKEFTSKPTTVPECNQGGREADKECTDKEGYTWYGYVISKEAIENEYYFTVHAANPDGKNGIYTHTLPYKLEDVTSDLYFVMDESGSNDGWYINAPVVVRASGDASFNGNNFADFVPLYVKDANTCTEKVTSFEWQKSDSENGTYTKYKSGEGINNIRTREAGWYRCKVTYLSGNTATSNAIQVTNTTSGTPGTLSFTSNLPIIMVNTNGVGFPDECTVSKDAYPSSNADKMKAKISVDVIIKKGNEILYDRKARMNYRGSSSLNFKKKSYAFVSGQDSCVFDKSRHDYVKTKKAKMLNILGVANYEADDKDWVLYAATADPSMIRNRLVFDLYQKMRPNDWGVHSTYVELVVDGVYKGVYVFMDKITANEKRVNITNPNGFIVKWDKTDCADRIGGYDGKVGDEKTFKTTRTGNKGIDTYDTKVDQLFEIEYPEKEDIEDDGGVWSNVYQPIIDRFEAFEEALATKNYVRVRDIIDYDSWADWFILNEFTKNLDAYRASCIFTYNGAQGDKIKAVPLWDQELSFDNAAANISGKGANSTSGLLIQNSGVYGDAFPAPFWFTGGGTSITGGLLNDPCFISIVKEKWATYTAEGGVLTSAKVNEMVDAYKADLGAISTAGTPIYRENAMIPFNDSSKAGRGATSSCTGEKAIGYFGYGNNCGSAVTHDNSITAIKNWIPSRITNLTSALNGLEGEALIFTFTPTEAETTPWVPVLFTVNAPQGYEYSMDYSKLPAGAVIKEGDNTISVKLPQPANWPTGGDGTNLSEQYTIKAILEADGGTSVCGTTIKTDKTSTITLKQTYEDCTP